jgi:hypothetical protein
MLDQSNLSTQRCRLIFWVECSVGGYLVLANTIQGVSEICMLILTSERTHQIMKLFSITFCKIRKSIPIVFVPQFLPNESFCVVN